MALPPACRAAHVSVLARTEFGIYEGWGQVEGLWQFCEIRRNRRALNICFRALRHAISQDFLGADEEGMVAASSHMGNQNLTGERALGTRVPTELKASLGA